MEVKPTMGQINLVVRDLRESLAFYHLLGVEFGEPTGLHATVTFSNGFIVDLDQHEFAQQWNSGTPPLNAGSIVLNLSVPERATMSTRSGVGWSPPDTSRARSPMTPSGAAGSPSSTTRTDTRSA
jgi:catechol 2,3-dioxygenase-like lactoylglutathione lyase family enzyme